MEDIDIDEDLAFMEYVPTHQEYDQNHTGDDHVYHGDNSFRYQTTEENNRIHSEERSGGFAEDGGYQSDYECMSADKPKICYSPSGSGNLYCVPNVPDNVRPKNGDVFKTIEEVEKMYYSYADHAGFDVRKHTTSVSKGVRVLRYLVCNREGTPNTSQLDTLDPSKCRTKRVDMIRRNCMAGIKCRLTKDKGGYELYDVEEMHNHQLFSREQMCMSKARRKISFYTRSYIYKMSKQNIGPTISHRLYAELQGGFNYVQGNTDDFKNCMRDLNCHIGGNDAQMLIDKLTARKNSVSNFTFVFREDKKKRLDALFWADDTSKLQYKEFGDVVSFDATFRTNRYLLFL